MKTTISDVARLAGVSTATVSHTINNTRYVSSETKIKVYRAIDQLGYTPDASARSFRTGKRKTIGFIVPDISNRFFGTMIESVENALSEKGYHLIIANTKEDMDREETNLRLLTAGLVDGLLVASTMDNFQRLNALIPAGFPVVLVDRTFDGHRYDSVSVSCFQSVYDSVRRLIQRGKRRVGLIAGLPRLSTTQERLRAYRAALTDQGLEVEEDLIRCGNTMDNSASSRLDALLKRDCDAILVCQGRMAAVTIAYLEQKGLRRDLELVSFVDYDTHPYEFYFNRADQIVQPVEELGRAAGEQILLRIETPGAPVRERVLSSVYQPYNGAGS